MASFKEIRELLLLSFENNTISDEEFLLLSEQFKSKNPDFPYENYLGFELDDMDESECLVEFRIEKRYIEKRSSSGRRFTVTRPVFVLPKISFKWN